MILLIVIASVVAGFIFGLVYKDPFNRDKECEDVREFQKKMQQIQYTKPGFVVPRKLRERLLCMMEELEEFRTAVIENDIEQQADALIDLVYFAKGTANILGLPWKELWNDVHRANMEKRPGIGKRGIKVDAIKPPGWVPPKTLQILSRHGLSVADYTSTSVGPNDRKAHLDERKMRDDLRDM